MDKFTQHSSYGDFIFGAFLDFPKPFDIIDHDMQVRISCTYGIYGCFCPENIKLFLTHIISGSQHRRRTDLLYRNNGFLALNSNLIWKYLFDFQHINLTHIWHEIHGNKGIIDPQSYYLLNTILTYNICCYWRCWTHQFNNIQNSRPNYFFQ